MSDLAQRIAHLSPQKRELLLRQLAQKQTPGEGRPRIPSRPRDGGEQRFPVSFSQLREWILVQLEPGTSAYNVPGTLRARGPLSIPLLRDAVAAVVARHETLRTSFAAGEDGEPVQVVAPQIEVELPVADLAALPPERREAEAWRLARAEQAIPFDIARSPLFRVRLVKSADDDHLVLVTVHHIVSDGWSMGIFSREVATFYGALAAGAAAPLPPLAVQYGDFAAWQRETLQGERLEEHLAFWRESLAGLPPLLRLPTDRPRPPVQGFRGARVPLAFGSGEVRGLQALARAQGTGLFPVLLGAWMALLSRLSGEEDLAVGTFSGTRGRVELEGLIGFFVNTLVLRGDLSGRPTFRQLAARLREVTLSAFAHGEIPFERLLEVLRLPRALSHTPLFQTMLVLQNYPTPVQGKGEVSLTPVEVDLDRSNFDLTLWLFEGDDRLSGNLEFSLDLFDPPTARRMAAGLEQLVRGALAEPDRPFAELPLESEAARHQVLCEWNDSARAPRPFAPVHRRFAEQAARAPEAPALLLAGEAMTYAALARRAGDFAAHLAARGVGPGTVVAVCLERSFDLIAAFLGVLGTGAAYLPLDPTYPRERLAFLLEDSDASLLVGRPDILPPLPADDFPLVTPEEVGPATVAAPAVEIHPDAPLCLIYTSGSTGRPKGVPFRHGALAAFVDTALELYRTAPGDRVLQFTSVSFDISLEEIYPTLAAGATLVLRPEARVQEPPEFFAEVAAQGVTVLDLPTSWWHELAAALERDPALAVPASVRLIILGGERVLPARAWAFRERVAGGPPRLLNTYGPAEATIIVSAADLTRDPWDPRRGEVPLGRPLPDVRLRLFDRHGFPVPLGAYGEVTIAGPGLTTGYWRRPDLTAERFVPDPWGSPGARLYRTGDLARHRPDGMLEFGGRVDAQVKIRGVRIEPGEVETVLTTHPAIREAAVAARGGGDSGWRLVAWYAPHEGVEPPHVGELREFLGSRLPDAMVPAAFVPLPELPLLPNGKIDRRALPEPEADRPALAHGYEAPRNDLEREIARVWAGVLGIERVGIHDNFFDLGGHSLLLVRAHAELQGVAGELAVVDLFRYPTVASLAGHVAGQATARLNAERVRDLGEKQRQALGRQRQAMAKVMGNRQRKG